MSLCDPGSVQCSQVRQKKRLDGDYSDSVPKMAQKEKDQLIVFACLLFWGMLGLFIPREYLRAYMVFASICLAALYFFFVPPITYDLSRYYELLHVIRKTDLWTVLFGDLKTNNILWETYSSGSRLYLLYAYIISLLRIDALLPFISGVIIYCCASKLVILAAEDSEEEIADWKLGFCFLFLLLMMDFRSISGIRNMLTFTVFAYILYYDLVRKSNRLVCWIAYIALIGFHSAIIILVLLRLLMLFKHVPIFVRMLIAFSFFFFVETLISTLSRFTQYPMVSMLLQKLTDYFVYGGSTYQTTRVVIRSFALVFYLLMYLYLKRSSFLPQVFNDYTDYFLLAAFFDFGTIGQYDTFLRMHFFLTVAVCPMLLCFLHRIVGETPVEIVVPDNNETGVKEVILYAMLGVSLIMVSYVFLTAYYSPMDGRFTFFLI
ncbi:MAG: hypothetical protein IKP22_10580 [Clostridia bacterium]|nr:hypothetical protein [Clostridia bacterium]